MKPHRIASCYKQISSRLATSLLLKRPSSPAGRGAGRVPLDIPECNTGVARARTAPAFTENMAPLRLLGMVSMGLRKDYGTMWRGGPWLLLAIKTIQPPGTLVLGNRVWEIASHTCWLAVSYPITFTHTPHTSIDWPGDSPCWSQTLPMWCPHCGSRTITP